MARSLRLTCRWSDSVRLLAYRLVLRRHLCGKRPSARKSRIESDNRHVKRRLRAMQGPRTMPTAHRVIQGIEALHMIRKAPLLGSQRTNLATTSIAFALLLKIA